ncbi:unnamed protein product [Amaranthus hypochondriacus]
MTRKYMNLASLYLISAFFAISLFSIIYLKYPHEINNLDYLHIIVPTKTTTLKLFINNLSTQPSLDHDEDQDDDELNISGNTVDLSQPLGNLTREERIQWIKQNLPKSKLLESTPSSRNFEKKLQQFVETNKCRLNIFMTWISTTKYFGKREIFSLESILKSHPNDCVIIISKIMASKYGKNLIKPYLEKGYFILTIAPDFPMIFHGTPAQNWLERLINGGIDPGKIPITQNLSNLLRIVVLYKYGGVYFDSDMIILKSVYGLRNCIGIQELDQQTNEWISVNNAVLIFDKNHPLLFRFLDEFNSSFNGNLWGHNGPFMATRVIKKVGHDSEHLSLSNLVYPTYRNYEQSLGKDGDDNSYPYRRMLPNEDDLRYSFSLLSPMAFYPVDWGKIKKFFLTPQRKEVNWANSLFNKVNEESYGVHLWNKVSRSLKIEEGSIIGRLISNNCIICEDVYGV